MKTLHLKNIFKAKTMHYVKKVQFMGSRWGRKGVCGCVCVGHLEDRLEEFL